MNNRRARFTPRLAACLALAVSVGGCGHADDVIVPTAVTPLPANRVEMLVATTRDYTQARPGEMYTGQRAVDVSHAEISVSIPPAGARKIGDIQWPSRLPANPATDFVTLNAEYLDLKEGMARLDRRIKKTPHHRVLVFVHGFNNRFEDAVYRFAQIIHDSKAPALPILFTWPSHGTMLAYAYDRESALYSRDALENLLKTLDNDKNVNEIDILAHSMGNVTALEALRQMSIRDGGLPRKIKEIMLAAPDVDIDVFRRQAKEIGKSTANVTLFVAHNDEALALSRRVWGDKDRLGAIDPNAEPYKTELAKSNIKVVDLTNAKSDDPIGHSRFAQSPAVVEAIGHRLAGGQALGGSVDMGEQIGQVALGAGNIAGTAAHLATSAPFAMTSARGRAAYGEHVDMLGSHAKETLDSAHTASPIPK